MALGKCRKLIRTISASLQKNTFILAVLLTGTTLSAVLGMQTQVYRNGVLCEQCSTGTHQYDNTVTYNKHSTSPGTTYYTEQRVVTSSNGAPVSTSSDYISTGTTTSNHNTQVTYEGSGNKLILHTFPQPPPPHLLSLIFGTILIIEICLSIITHYTRTITFFV